MSQEVLVIKIADHDYTIKLGDQDPKYIKKLAQYVNKKFNEFRENFPKLPYQKLMVVVCLNIADEFLKCSQEEATRKDGNFNQEDNKKISEMLDSLKQILVE